MLDENIVPFEIVLPSGNTKSYFPNEITNNILKKKVVTTLQAIFKYNSGLRISTKCCEYDEQFCIKY